eukprot:TRINITY_DN4895_c0_g1_i1.p1 TRINITY_DN4895_c0_g1~~TRINITY_DN4895_c0_g1_i1.p1  ORF type:complete len:584 (-),score=119.54 TRINITY_DN4895_c0_g1_i1:1172-2668(-)
MARQELSMQLPGEAAPQVVVPPTAAAPVVPTATAAAASRYPVNALPTRKHVSNLSMNDTIRQELLQRNVELMMHLPADSALKDRLPDIVVHYHSLYPRDVQSRQKTTRAIGVSTTAYKCISARYESLILWLCVFCCRFSEHYISDGRPYLLRRVDGVRAASEQAVSTVTTAWSRVRHPNIVQLKEIFVKKFDEVPSLLVTHDYHAGSSTLEERFLGTHSPAIDEAMLWSITTQLVAAIHAVHNAGLACRVVDTTKILITGTDRVRLNCVGIVEVLEFDAAHQKSLPQLQYEDLYALGKLLLALACKSSNAIMSIGPSLDNVTQYYSAELKTLIVYLLTKPTATSHAAVSEICTMIAPRLLQAMDSCRSQADVLEGELSRELENGRLFRLSTKLAFINERQEYGMDAQWAETGDRYLLKLLRDYIYHQIDENGDPYLDVGHVVDTLNRLDVGDTDKVMLVSRDEQSVLVVSYFDLKNCIEAAYQELVQRSAQTTAALEP